MNNGTIRAQADRFWARVNKDGPEHATLGRCWTWTGAVGHNGYGQIAFHAENPIKTRRAHRLAWELMNGRVPGGLYVLHHCDNRRCVNPAHLYLGTPGDNSTDMRERGRSEALLTPAQVSEIRRARAALIREFADRFSVPLRIVRDIVGGATWKSA